MTTIIWCIIYKYTLSENIFQVCASYQQHQLIILYNGQINNNSTHEIVPKISKVIDIKYKSMLLRYFFVNLTIDFF